MSHIVAFSLPPFPVQTFFVVLDAISHEFSPVLTPLLPSHTRICTLVVPCCASTVGVQIPSAMGAARVQGRHVLTEWWVNFAHHSKG